MFGRLTVGELLIIDGDTVRQLLTMPLCIDAMKTAAVALSGDGFTAPNRMILPLKLEKDAREGQLLVMPGAFGGGPVYGIKVISFHPDNPRTGRPAFQGVVNLFDQETGAPIAVIDGLAITAIRTAAASGMATGLLAPRHVKTHGIFGAGVQARAHAAAIIAARPSIEKTLIWARDNAKAESLAETLKSELGISVRACGNAKTVAACDVVSTVTGSPDPVLKSEWVNAGAHLNAVGAHTPLAREVDTETVLRSRVFVETIATAFKEAGELIIPEKEGVFSRADVVAEIGDVAAGKHEGRKSSQEITLYKSLGNAAQDLYAAWTVYDQAKSKGAGTSVKI